MKRSLAAVLVLALVACGGGGSAAPNTPSPTPTPTRLAVAGTYSTAVALAEDACGDVAVQPLPTTVTHNPGETRVTLTHGGLSHVGTVQTDGAFRTDSVAVTDGAGAQHALAMTGRFTTTGFEARVGVDVRRANGVTCRYVVAWTGTKQGSPNVIL